MLDKRLINLVPESIKFIVLNVVCLWMALVMNIVLIGYFAHFIELVQSSGAVVSEIGRGMILIFTVLVIKSTLSIAASKMGYEASIPVKLKVRGAIYDKLLRKGPSFAELASTAELVQLSTEGVDQLVMYFGSYLPQLFYSFAASLTLFIVIGTMSIQTAIVLLACVPLIPISIILVQSFAKSLFSKYWTQYSGLGNSFLENLQGLTTLKIYRADEFKNEEMNREAEKFRVITMKVLTMQLNSIAMMDLVAYGGAAIGAVITLIRFHSGTLSFFETVFIILLAADFFIPLRQLGSFFHVAMNGIAAGDRILRILDAPDTAEGSGEFPKDFKDIVLRDIGFSYTEDRRVLTGIDMELYNARLTSIVGESGCGKSTIASVLTGKLTGYIGNIRVGGVQLSDLSHEQLTKHIVYVGYNSYLFKGSVRENLKLGCMTATDEQLWNALEESGLSDFVLEAGGLDMQLSERGSNLSGGQRQRLSLARALLFDAEVYIFDEATSNIDVESEKLIMRKIISLASNKTVLLISHRLANVVDSDRIYVLKDGKICCAGDHNSLLNENGVYSEMWNSQLHLERIRGESI